MKNLMLARVCVALGTHSIHVGPPTKISSGPRRLMAVRCRRGVVAGIIAVMLVNPAAGLAHHSVVANFDRDSPVELSGTISEVHIRNPHSQYVLDVTDGQGDETEWFIEWADKNALTRRGVDLELIKPGDDLTITVWPSHRLEHVGYFVRAILPDGSTYRDCGFIEFRKAVVDSQEFSCEEARGGQ
jgi:hypothetical protein